MRISCLLHVDTNFLTRLDALSKLKNHSKRSFRLFQMVGTIFSMFLSGQNAHGSCNREFSLQGSEKCMLCPCAQFPSVRNSFVYFF